MTYLRLPRAQILPSGSQIVGAALYLCAKVRPVSYDGSTVASRGFDTLQWSAGPGLPVSSHDVGPTSMVDACMDVGKAVTRECCILQAGSVEGRWEH